MHNEVIELHWELGSAKLHKHGLMIFNRGSTDHCGLWWDQFLEVLAKAKSHGFITQEQIDGTN